MKYITLLIRLLLTAVFLMAGYAKLSGNPMMVQVFAAVGLGQWFRYLTGSLEVAGALGLLNGHTAGPAAVTLTAVMAGAVLTHVLILGGSAAMPLGLLLMSAWVAYERYQAWQGAR
jgi:putative oxidoreductase